MRIEDHFSPCIKTGMSVPDISPWTATAMAPAELNPQQIEYMVALNSKMFQVEQRMLADILQVRQRIGILLTRRPDDYFVESAVYCCLHQDDPCYLEGQSNILCTLTMDWRDEVKDHKYKNINWDAGKQWPPEAGHQTDSALIYAWDALRLHHQWAPEPHSVLLQTLLWAMVRNVRSDESSIWLSNILRLGEFHYEIKVRLIDGEDLSVTYPSRLHALSSKAGSHPLKHQWPSEYRYTPINMKRYRAPSADFDQGRSRSVAILPREACKR